MLSWLVYNSGFAGAYCTINVNSLYAGSAFKYVVWM